MRYSTYFTVMVLLALLPSCHKDDPIKPPVDPPPNPPDTVAVPIYFPCYTTWGVATAKKLTADWRAGASARKVTISGATYWVIELTTCTANGSQRELLTFGAIPESNPVQYYTFQYWHNGVVPGTVDPGCFTRSADGDVSEDIYSIDTTAAGNFFEIDRWDTTKRQVEGRFSYSGDIRQPRQNPKNPAKVAFTSGKFNLRLPE